MESVIGICENEYQTYVNDIQGSHYEAEKYEEKNKTVRDIIMKMFQVSQGLLPETGCVPVSVQSLQVLLIIDPLSATGTYWQTAACTGQERQRVIHSYTGGWPLQF